MTHITPVFRKDNPLDKLNYRSISALPLLSKVYFKGLIYNQLSEFSESVLIHFYLLHNPCL